MDKNKFIEEFKKLSLSAKRDKVIQLENYQKNVSNDIFISLLEEEEDPICKWYVIRALGNYSAEEVGDSLLNVLLQPDFNLDNTSLHLIAADSIGKLGKAMTDRILGLLKSDDDSVILAAIDTLGMIRDPKAINYLVPYIASSNRKISLWAGLALGKIGKQSVSKLVSELNNANENKAIIILDALCMIPYEDSVDAIIKLIQQYPNVGKSYFGNYLTKNAQLFKNQVEKNKDLDKRANEFLLLIN